MSMWICTEDQNRSRKQLVGELAGLRQKVAELEAFVASVSHMEKALRESEERYRSLVKQSSEGVYIFDPATTRILEANGQFLRMLGYTGEEIASLTLYDIVFMDPDIVADDLWKVRQDSHCVAGLRQHTHKDGTLVDVEIGSTTINYAGSPAVMVTVRDITGRMRAEEELQAQAAILQEQSELLDIAQDAIIVLDMDSKILFWNRGAEDLYGWSTEEALNKVGHILLKTKFPESREMIRAKLILHERWDGELAQETKTGTTLIMESRWALRRDRQGNPSAIMEINNDITQRKRAEDAFQKAKDELETRVIGRTTELQNANERLTLELTRRKRIEEMLRKGAERYRNLFENSPLGIYRANSEGRILMANPALLRMLGYSSFDELASANSKKGAFEPTYLRKKFKKKLEREGRVRGFEARWKRPHKSTIFVRENAKAILGNDGSVLYYEGTVEDISEQRKAEGEIQSYQGQLRSLASELSLAEERERRRVATALHDHIGQILAISKIKLGALVESPLTGPYVSNLKEIREHIEQAIQYTRSLTFELSPPILYELGLESALEWLAEQIEEQHGIQCEFEDDNKPKPVSDEVRVFIFTAVRELLVNIAKHAKANKAKVSIRKAGSDMSIHVADNGIGFNASKVKLYLDENKGFGLFSIRERLHHLGGQMEVKSQQGRGTRVFLSAPLKEEERCKEKTE